MQENYLMYNCKYCGKECKNANSLRNHERLCKQNPNRQLTSYEKYGPIAGFNNKGRSAWNLGLTKDIDDRVRKNGQGVARYYKSHPGSFTGKTHSADVRKILSQKASINNLTKFDKLSGRGKRGYYKGIYCQSSWELAYVIFCIDHNINFKRNTQHFDYIFENQRHNYFPDFYLPDIDTYVEIKGYYDLRSKIKASQFKGNLQVLTLEQMQPILAYVKEYYGDDFTKLYD